MAKVAAVYCVYEDSGFLTESVRRIYHLVDKVIFLLNFQPWNGHGDPSYLDATFDTIQNMLDPDHKIQIVSQYWESEAAQRNYSLELCRNLGIQWNFIIDDDELYNFEDLKKQIARVRECKEYLVYLSPQQVYWKDRDHCIANIVGALPSFVSTEIGKTRFTEARAIEVNGGNWYTFEPHELLNHHMSYVRSNEKMLRKIRTFSHADPSLDKWFTDIWVKWHADMEGLHPNQENPMSFSKAIDKGFSPYKLEECKTFSGANLESHYLRQAQYFKSKVDTGWLKSDPNTSCFIDFWYKFTSVLVKRGQCRFVEFSPEPSFSYYTFCEALHQYNMKESMGLYELHGEIFHVGSQGFGATNSTYEYFSHKRDFGATNIDFVHIVNEVPHWLKTNWAARGQGYVGVSKSLTDNKVLFEKLREGRPYYEYKMGYGFGLIEWNT